jgi:hypothetical protein
MIYFSNLQKDNFHMALTASDSREKGERETSRFQVEVFGRSF